MSWLWSFKNQDHRRSHHSIQHIQLHVRLSYRNYAPCNVFEIQRVVCQKSNILPIPSVFGTPLDFGNRKLKYHLTTAVAAGTLLS